MTAVSLGVWVRHAHAAAATPHVHGWGWCPGAFSKADSSPRTDPVAVHRHLLFCGFECPNEPPAEGAPPDAPADGVSVIDSPCERPTSAELPDPADVPFTTTPTPPPASETPAVEPDRFVSRHLPLSAFACRKVSGVLRS